MENCFLLLNYNTSHEQFEKAEKGQGQGQREGKNMGTSDKIQLAVKRIRVWIVYRVII